MKPFITALIDTYNQENYIESAITSVLEQDFPASEMEIIVVDDGSTDRTPEIARKFAPRVRLLRKKNGGQASAFNAAIPEARAEIISFLDGDDWFAPGKLSAVMNAFQEHPEAAAIGHGHYLVQSATNEARPRVPPSSVFVHLSNPQASREAFAAWPFLLMGALTIRRETLQPILPIPEELTFCADSPITVAAMAGGTYVLKDPLFYYRHHADNLHATDPTDAARNRRTYEMKEKAYRLTEPLLVRLNVPQESLSASFYPAWTELSRFNLRTYGGSPLDTFRTEMRFFRLQYPHPTVPHTLYKYLLCGAATLLLPPRAFYRLQDWSSRPHLNRLRKALFRANRTPA